MGSGVAQGADSVAPLEAGCQIVYSWDVPRRALKTRIEITAHGGQAEFSTATERRVGQWKVRGTRECHRFLNWAERLGLARPSKGEEKGTKPAALESLASSVPSETLKIQWTAGTVRTWDLRQKSDSDARSFVEFLVRFAQKRTRKRGQGL